MSPLSFDLFSIEHWLAIVLWSFFFGALLYFSVRKLAFAGVFDPLHLAYTFTFGTTYAVIVCLFIDGQIENYLFFMVAVYGVIFICLLNFFARFNVRYFSSLVNVLVPPGRGRFEFIVILIIYFFISFFVLYSIGFGFFAETNRFDNNRGFGAFVRVLDVLSVFIVAYSAAFLSRRHREFKGRDLIQYGWFALLIFFILYSSLVNGAKAALIFSFMTVILAAILAGARIRLGFFKVLSIVTVATFFAVIGLSINLEMNGISASGESQYVDGVPIVLDRLIHRVIANGNQSYLSLPGEVINKIETDSIFVRFFAPMVGSTRLGKYLGYNVSNYSVGRQILLYYDPNRIVAGGPTSHFDLFAYTYFGLCGGIFFITLIAYVLGTINWEMRRVLVCQDKSIFYVAILTTLWVRSMATIIEPTTGFAYILDVFIVFLIFKLFSLIMRTPLGCGAGIKEISSE